MDRRTLLKGTAIASAAAGIVGARHGVAAAAVAPGPRGIRYVTFAGADFKTHHGTIAQATYWDNGSTYGIRVGEGYTGFAVRLELPDGVTIVEASANLRYSSGEGPAFLLVLAFDTHDAYQVIGQKQINDPSPDLIRSVALDVTPTVVDGEKWSYLFRWFPSHLETIKRNRPDAPEQLLWGARIGYRHGAA